MHNRRDFLRHSGLLGASLGLTGVSFQALALNAIQTEKHKVLFVFLRGAYDGLNLLVPHQESLYFELRPKIAIKKDALIPITNTFSLPPSVAESLVPLFTQKELTFIPCAGTPDNSRSHFHTQDLVEGGLGDVKTFESGFAYRLFEALGGSASALSYTNNLPLAFKGTRPIANISLNSKLRLSANARQDDMYAKLYANSKLAPLQQENSRLSKELSMQMDEEMMSAGRQAAGPRAFATQAPMVAKFMKEQRGATLGFIDVGGWDTHINQGGTQGTLSNGLKELGGGLMAFKKAMGADWIHTTVIVFSEFGRTVKENGNGGTDHGNGNVMWVLGGNINGGKIAGDWSGLRPKDLHENRDLPVLNDYRAVIGSVLKPRLNLNNQQMEKVFPRSPMKNFDI